MSTSPKRATTPERKKEVTTRLLVAWQSQPDLRLGQLLLNAKPGGREDGPWLYNIEDDDLVTVVEGFIKRL